MLIKKMCISILFLALCHGLILGRLVRADGPTVVETDGGISNNKQGLWGVGVRAPLGSQDVFFNLRSEKNALYLKAVEFGSVVQHMINKNIYYREKASFIHAGYGDNAGIGFGFGIGLGLAYGENSRTRIGVNGEMDLPFVGTHTPGSFFKGNVVVELPVTSDVTVKSEGGVGRSDQRNQTVGYVKVGAKVNLGK